MLTGLLLVAALTIRHEPVDCVVQGQFSDLVAEIAPGQKVSVRLYFKAAPDHDDFYYVPMTLRSGTVQSGRFGARLPKPKDKHVTYYIQAVLEDGTSTQTPQASALAVKDGASCPDEGRVAKRGQGADLRVFATTISTRKPDGFDGVSMVYPLKPAAPATAPASPEEIPAASPPTGRARPAPPAPGPKATAAPAATPDAGSKPAARPNEYVIGSGDILRIVVYGQDALTQSVVVQPDGTIMFPLIGRVKAADLTPDELQRQTVALLAKDFVRNPQVTVTVQEYRSKSVYVVGEIAKPGTYPLEGNTTIIQILARAGPTTGNAGSEVVVVRPAEEVKGPVLPTDVAAKAAKATAIRVNLAEIEAGDLEKNISLQPGDTVFIPQASKVFVTGEVRSPGGFSFRPGTTVRQVISLAGGFSERSSRSVRVVRQKEGGKKEEKKIGLEDPVLAGDILIVKAKLF